MQAGVASTGRRGGQSSLDCSLYLLQQFMPKESVIVQQFMPKESVNMKPVASALDLTCLHYHRR
jgi:hypothetical protein